MTPQQALEEARKRYTEGTRYACVKAEDMEDIFQVESNEGFSIFNDKYIYGERGKGVLYGIETDKWAGIISTPISLEDRLVEKYGFVKRTFPHGEFITNRYEKDGLSIDFDYENGKVVSVDAQIESHLVANHNPNNLEDFIKAYLRLF